MVCKLDEKYCYIKTCNKHHLQSYTIFLIILSCGIITTNISFTEQTFAIPTESKDRKTSVTAYNQDLGLIKNTRVINLTSGFNTIDFTDVALFIDPTSVSTQFDDNCCIIQEQSYEYDLSSIQKLLQKYKGKEVTLIFENGVNNQNYNNVTDDDSQYPGNLNRYNHNLTHIYLGSPNENKDNLPFDGVVNITGTLLSFESDNALERLIISSLDGKLYLIPIKEIKLISLSPSISYPIKIKPTLLLKIFNNESESGPKQIELSYLTRGINWKADYVATVNNNDSRAKLNGWVTLNNDAGTSFHNATVKFVAGDVNTAAGDVSDFSSLDRSSPYAAKSASEESSGPIPSMTTNPFSEYHIYSMNFTTDIDNGQSKHFQLLDYPNIAIDKTYEYNIPGFVSSSLDESNSDVESVILFNNSKEKGLGIPLPAGTVKMFKKDIQGDAQFIGEDNILHTPVNENMTLKMGNVFDITASTIVTESSTISEDTKINSYNVTLRNHKNSPVDVLVNVNDLYGNWMVLENSMPFTKKDASTIQFPVNNIGPNTSKSFTYTIQRIY